MPFNIHVDENKAVNTIRFLSADAIQSVYAPASGLQRGAYVLADLGSLPAQIILMATGSQVSLIVKAGEILASEGLGVRLVSFPCWELFEDQDREYQESVLPSHIKARLAVEAGVAQGWCRWVGGGGDMISIDHFGSSAPYPVLADRIGFNVENVLERARELL